MFMSIITFGAAANENGCLVSLVCGFFSHVHIFTLT